MKPTTFKRGRAVLVGVTLTVAGAAGAPFVAGAVGLDSAVGNCSTVGANSTFTICPLSAASTGAGGASHVTDPGLIAGGGVAVAAAAAAAGVALRRRSLRRATEA